MLIALITLWVIVVMAITFFMHACKKLNEQFDNDSWENSVRHDIMNDRINKHAEKLKRFDELEKSSLQYDLTVEKVNKLETIISLMTKPSDAEPETAIKRTKVSLRNPLRTFEAHYDNYKGRESNLYEPVKPKRKAGRNEVDVNDV